MRLTVLLLLIGATLGTIALWSRPRPELARPEPGGTNPIFPRPPAHVPVQFGASGDLEALVFDVDSLEVRGEEARTLRAAGMGLPDERVRFVRVLVWNGTTSEQVIEGLVRPADGTLAALEFPRLENVAPRRTSAVAAWAGPGAEVPVRPGCLRSTTVVAPADTPTIDAAELSLGGLRLKPMLVERAALLRILDGRTWPPDLARAVQPREAVRDRPRPGVESADESSPTPSRQPSGR